MKIMKKLIVAGIVVAMAVSAQAAAVSWVASGIANPVTGVNDLTTVNSMYVELYFATAAFDNTFGWETGNRGSAGTLILGGQSSAISSGRAIVNGSTSGDLGFQFWNQATAIANRDAAGPNQGFASFFMKIYYSPTGIAGTGNYTYSGITDLYTLDLRNIADVANATAMSKISTDKHVTWTPAVPEPTTMALFGLGGLALMIRRKMRKEA